MKKLTVLTIAMALVLSLTACGGSNAPAASNTTPAASSAAGPKAEPAAPAGGTTKIQFMHTMIEQERQEIIENLITAFESANADIDVEQIPTDEDSYDTKITSLGGSGQLPNIMEFSQEQAKMNAKNGFVDYSVVREAIEAKGESAFFSGVLDVIKTEDGAEYIGVPVGGWVQGIWYDKAQFSEKNLAAPDSWENILAAAKAFSDPTNRKYGIALPTASDGFAQQSFSQFAMSNNANVLNAEGKASFNTPEMIEALAFYKELYQYTMPGSNDVTAVKDAFMNGSAPMAIYSTYMIPSLNEAGTIGNAGFAIPQNKSQSVYGHIGLLSAKADMDEAEKAATVKFLQFMLEDSNNIAWLHMSPGGQQPVIKAVADSSAYLDNEVIKSFAAIADDIAAGFNSIKAFGSVDGKNFLVMGDITSSNLIPEAVNRVTVKGEQPEAVAEAIQKELEKITN